MVSLEPVWIVGCQLLFRFYIGSWKLPQVFQVRSIKFVNFKLCAAFHAFLRVGEMTSTTGLGPRPLQIHQVVQLVNDSNTIVSLKIVFEDFKHSYNQPPSSMVINRVPIFCPVQLMLDYLALPGNKPGPLFITLHGHPVSRANFTDQLSLAIKFCGLNPARYKGHSFRIGAASHAADRGLSDAQIRVLGRWKSNAFHRYIRIPSLST